MDAPVMSATQALRAAWAQGVVVAIEGDDLLLEAASRPPGAVLEALARHKPAIVALLRPASGPRTPDDWRAFFEERASIAAFDGGLNRTEAEAQAFECCIREWRRLVPTAPVVVGYCALCSQPFAEDRVIVSLHPHAWLHPHCWKAWNLQRWNEAAAGLRKAGINAQLTNLRDWETNNP